jgi:hypothetical protein
MDFSARPASPDLADIVSGSCCGLASKGMASAAARSLRLSLALDAAGAFAYVTDQTQDAVQRMRGR